MVSLHFTFDFKNKSVKEKLIYRVIASFMQIGPVKVMPYLGVINEFISVLSKFIVRHGWNSVYEICTDHIGHVWISSKLEQGKPHFSYRRQQNYIYACTVKMYDILKTSNPLVKFKFSHYTTTILIKVTFNIS